MNSCTTAALIPLSDLSLCKPNAWKLHDVRSGLYGDGPANGTQVGHIRVDVVQPEALHEHARMRFGDGSMEMSEGFTVV